MSLVAPKVALSVHPVDEALGASYAELLEARGHEVLWTIDPERYEGVNFEEHPEMVEGKIAGEDYDARFAVISLANVILGVNDREVRGVKGFVSAHVMLDLAVGRYAGKAAYLTNGMPTIPERDRSSNGIHEMRGRLENLGIIAIEGDFDKIR